MKNKLEDEITQVSIELLQDELEQIKSRLVESIVDASFFWKWDVKETPESFRIKVHDIMSKLQISY